MTTPKVGSRDSKGRYWDGKQYVSLDQAIKKYNQSRGYNWFNRPPQQGTSSRLPGIGEIRYDRNYGWQTKSSYEKGMSSSGAGDQPKLPAPITIKNTQGKTQQVTPGKGYSYTKPDGTRGYMVYDNKGAGKFTAYPDKSPVPPAAPPVAEPSGPRNDRRTAPPAAPVRQTPPEASPVAKYMAAAAAARKSGDPAQMAAVRDQGLAIWRDKYKDTLAKKVSPTGQQLGTGQSVMSKQAAELRALRPTPEAPVNTSASTPAPVSAPQPPVKTDTATQRVQAAQKPIPPTVKPIDTSKMSTKKGTSTGTLAASYEYDAYDLVLEYLLSNGHADTLLEAQYVMMQMSAEHIQSIING